MKWRLSITAVLFALLSGVSLAQESKAPATAERKNAPRATTSDLASDAEAALKNGDFDGAISKYDQLRKQLPHVPEIPYNMGVAAYRKGEYDRAAELFAQTLSMANDPKLRGDSAYNLGTSAYAQSLNPALNQMNPAATEQIDQASEELQRALEHYRQALDLTPKDADAAANAELAYRRLQNLEAMKREMQQMQNQPGETQQNQNQDQQQQQQQQNDQNQQNQDQNNPQENPQDNPQQQDQQNSQDQQQNSANGEQDEQQPQDSQNAESQDQQEQDQQQQQAGAEEQQDEQNQSESSPQENPDPQQSQSGKEGMTKDEADRLLQMVRDKERKRQQQLQNKQHVKLPPVDKDW